MKALIYSKDNCGYCSMAKSLLARYPEIEVEEIMVGSDITIDEFRKILPEAKTVPQIFINDNLIGGYDSLKMFITEHYAVQTG